MLFGLGPTVADDEADRSLDLQAHARVGREQRIDAVRRCIGRRLDRAVVERVDPTVASANLPPEAPRYLSFGGLGLIVVGLVGRMVTRREPEAEWK